MGIFCKNCNKELIKNEDPCLSCGCFTKKYIMECKPAVYNYTQGNLKWKHKRPGLGVIMEGTNRPHKISGNPELAGGVSEIYVIDRIKRIWHQTVTDLKNGKIIHEEHISLKEKNKNTNERINTPK